ncbi:MAG: hypothetical protein FD177_2709 [Desulfovibrionaceae bacterium]|nr:MAG: hypothetical protein FD177_2709 [Desulfovibrionaceae bacterium]
MPVQMSRLRRGSASDGNKGTFCSGKIQSRSTSKLADCLACPFRKCITGELGMKMMVSTELKLLQQHESITRPNPSLLKG